MYSGNCNNPGEPKQILAQLGRFAMVVLWLVPLSLWGGDKQLVLPQQWLIHTGDDAVWAADDYNDQLWQKVDYGKNWEEAGLPDYDGYAWYRVHVQIPESFTDSLQYNFLSLHLGLIDDVDETWVNGTLVGSTGTFPPSYSTAYADERVYRVPLGVLRPGADNVIAIRVYDGAGPGGAYDDLAYLTWPGLSDLIGIELLTETANGIFHSPQNIKSHLKIHNYSKHAFRVKMTQILESDRVDTLIEYQRDSRYLDIAGEGTIEETVQWLPEAPGFYRVRIALADENQGMVSRSFIMGYDPEKISVDLTRQGDFFAFWAERKKELAEIEPSFKLIESDQSNADLTVYVVEMRSYGNVLIRGWYTVPKQPGPHPAILSVPGYTSAMTPYMERKNVATLALDPRGHGMSKDDVDPNGGEFMYLGFDPEHPEKYIYAGVFMDCIRGLDFLFSRPEIDHSRVGVEGESQGGGLSFATAALDQRVLFSAPDIPWLGDWLGYWQLAPWPRENYQKLIRQNPGLTVSAINRLLSYFDTMNLAEKITCPVFLSLGLQDDVCPPHTIFATYNRVGTSKEYQVDPDAGHGLGSDYRNAKIAWMARQFGQAEQGL